MIDVVLFCSCEVEKGRGERLGKADYVIRSFTSSHAQISAPTIIVIITSDISVSLVHLPVLVILCLSPSFDLSRSSTCPATVLAITVHLH